MMLTLAAVTALSLLVRSSSQEDCGCCGLAKQLISDPGGLVKISANPFLEGDNAKVESTTVEISEGNDQGAWCSVLPPGRTAYNPYLTFEFNSTYLIETVKISGLYNPNMYVTALTIQNDTGQGFVFISDNPKVFSTFLESGGDVRNISLMDGPVLATSLQIRPLNWTGNYPCMRIELHGCLSNTSQNPSSAIDANDTDNGRCPQKDILITLGIGAGLAGSLVTMAIILAAVVIVCCYRQFKKRRLRNPKKRSSSMDSDATLRVVNNILYRKRRSDKRPLAPSTASTLVYETVPGDQDPNSKETAKPQDEEEQSYEEEVPNKQESAKATPVYEIQYEPVKIDEGLCVIQEEGEDMDDAELCKLKDQTGESKGTISSHHSYEIIKDRQDAVLEASSESFVGNPEKGTDMDDNHLQPSGSNVAGTGQTKRAAKKKYSGAKNVMYENVPIALSPDSRHALFCESSGPQHFAV